MATIHIVTDQTQCESDVMGSISQKLMLPVAHELPTKLAFMFASQLPNQLSRSRNNDLDSGADSGGRRKIYPCRVHKGGILHNRKT